MTTKIQDQSGETCYAHACTRIMLHAWRRVIGATLPTYEVLVGAIIGKYGANGANCEHVIEYFGNPATCWSSQEFQTKFVQLKYQVSKNKGPGEKYSVTSQPASLVNEWGDYQWLPKLLVTDVSWPAAKANVGQPEARHLLCSFSLSGKVWDKFSAHFDQNPTIPLAAPHLMVPNDQ